MKKAAVLSITAFYLLLTTGMFVCMVHCTAANFASTPVVPAAMDHHDMPCCKQSKKDCSKKHSNYVIKENIKPATEVQFAQIAISVPHMQLANFVTVASFVQVILPKQTKAPPDKSGRAIIIQNQSFLI